MSLHLGNLSSRVRRVDLERVFRKFGRCNVRVKDRFGFVVYDFPANAEEALRKLRGKNICGEPITVSWSNRQPRPLQRAIGASGRAYEPHRERNSVREGYGSRKLESDGRHGYRMRFKQSDADGTRLNSADLPGETTYFDQDNTKGHMGKGDRNILEDLADEGGSMKPNYVDNDRWGEQIDNPLNENDIENGLEFDRYEPYHGDDRKDEDEIHHGVQTGGSPAVKDPQDQKGIVQSGEATLKQIDNMKFQQACYKCGELGHKMRNCPQENVFERELLSRYENDSKRQNDINYRSKGENELKRVGSKLRGRQGSGKSAVMRRTHEIDREASNSRMYRQLIKGGYSRAEDDTYRSRGSKNEKKKRRKENGSPERHSAKKSRRPMSTPIHSDYTAPRSVSPRKSTSGSASHSRLGSDSLSSSSSSSSMSYRSRSKNKKSRSGSRSPTSLSLSVSFGLPLPSSPNKLQMNHRDTSVKVASPASKEMLVESRQQLEGDAGIENPKLEIATAVDIGSAVAPFTVNGNVDMNLIQTRENNHNLTEETNLLLEEGDRNGGSFTPYGQRDVRDNQHSDICISKHVLLPSNNPESEVIVGSDHPSKSKSITSEEMYMVLKHYGLKHPEENAKDLPMETYFGSARLWPWEIIYHRRLRKGPISTENYARRMAQNKEFGIVDKYVRSSSGWGELGEGNS